MKLKLYYECPCKLVTFQSYISRQNTRNKEIPNWANCTSKCKMCDAKHKYFFKNNPFNEKLEAVSNLNVEVHIEGKFKTVNGKPILSSPDHRDVKAEGYHLKGEERKEAALNVKKQGVLDTYLTQMDKANFEELKVKNTTSVHSYAVLRQSRYEKEKKEKGGPSFYESAKNLYESEVEDFTTNFDLTQAAKKYPGIIRQIQEIPFKIMATTFDQMKTAVSYLNQNEEGQKTIMHMDSSGNHLKKCSKTLLNTSFCIPPFESGQSPYSLFDLISSSNKTTDFIVAFQWFYSYLRDITNSEVNFPDICITDMSFAQLHSITEFFNKTKLEEYINF